jgi:hypothetical protein
MSSLAVGLHKVSSAELVRLVRAIAREDFADPVTRAALVLAKFGHLEDQLDALVGRDKAAATAILSAVLHERSSAPARAVTGVWSGPAPTGQGTRDVYDSLLELIATAEQSLLLTGADLERDARLLRSLHSAQRGRSLHAVVVLSGAAAEVDRSALEELARELFQERLPWPELYVPDVARVRSAIPVALLADHKRALILSGAPPAIEAEDYELTQGVLVEDDAVVTALWAQWQVLIDGAALLPLRAASEP